LPGLSNLTFDEFLKLLRAKGRTKKADELEARVMERLCPPLDRGEIMKATVEAVAIAAEIISLSAMASGTIQSRIDELKGEGFAVLPGEGHAI
jgi:hypothetical protein